MPATATGWTPVVRPLRFLHAAHRSSQGQPGQLGAARPTLGGRRRLTALLAGSLLAALVWHATRLDPVDAWVMRWQELASAHARGLAVVVSATLGPVALLTMVAGAALGWLVKRRDLVALALAAVPVTLAVEILLQRVVHRQWEGGPALVFPSGHAAIATAAALTAVVAVRIAPVARPARLAAVCLTGGYALAIAMARLVETVHPLTDVLGGTATGLVVTLGGGVGPHGGVPARSGPIGRALLEVADAAAASALPRTRLACSCGIRSSTDSVP
jgi:membrane-associated phospholipid phosphatase